MMGFVSNATMGDITVTIIVILQCDYASYCLLPRKEDRRRRDEGDGSKVLLTLSQNELLTEVKGRIVFRYNLEIAGWPMPVRH